MLRKKSISNAYLKSILSVALLLLISFIIFWISQSFFEFNKENKELEELYINEIKQTIQHEVDEISELIKHYRSQTENILKTNIKNRVYEAYYIAENLNNIYKDSLDIQKIQTLVIETLRSIRYNEGKGYYFATNLEGVTQLFADKPEIEGVNIYNMQDTRGNYVIQDMIDIAKNIGEGFYEYSWSKPGIEGIDFPKIAFVKYFKPFNWYIGTGEYLDDIEEDIKKKVLEHISEIPIREYNNIFIVDFNGNKLLDNNYLFEIEDSNKVEFLEEVKKIVNQNLPDGFIFISYSNNKNEKLSENISFINVDYEWGWIIGVTYTTENMSKMISIKKKELRSKLINELLFIILIFILILIITIIMGRFFTKRLQKQFNLFKICLQDASLKNKKINSSDFRIAEIKNLSDYVNNIVDEKIKIEEELLKTRKLKSLGVFAGGIAHDFNNILTGILGNISILKYKIKDSPNITEILIKAEEASLRAKDLTYQLLTFSKGGAPIKETAEIQEIVKQSVSFILRGSNVLCKYDIADDLWNVSVDKGQINQVINNLIINADQALPDGGVVNVSIDNIFIDHKVNATILPGKYIKICIKDNGVGIPKKNISEIFDPYFTTKEDGQGLGLASVYSIINKHNGYIFVESIIGTGSTFTIYLPTTEKKVEVKKKKRTESKNLKKIYNILIMDDEEIIHMVIGEILKELKYKFKFVYNGSDAIEIYKKNYKTDDKFDLVIMDITIPGGMGGEKSINELLKIDPKVKAIVSSGYSNDPIMSKYKEYGFKGVIIKPFNMEDLENVINKVIHNGK